MQTGKALVWCVLMLLASTSTSPQEGQLDEKRKSWLAKRMSSVDLRDRERLAALQEEDKEACFKNKWYEVCFDGNSYPELFIEAHVKLTNNAALSVLHGFYPGTQKQCSSRGFVDLSIFEFNESELFSYKLYEDDWEGRIGKEFTVVIEFWYEYVFRDQDGIPTDGWRENQCHRAFRWQDRGKNHDWELEWLGPIDCSCPPTDIIL